MANAGRYGVNIGSGAASGAAAGLAFGPWGAAIGGGLGALSGGLSTLFQTSEEARERERVKAAMMKRDEEAAGDDWERRFAALTGAASDPRYIAGSYEPYDAAASGKRADEAIDLQMPEQEPNYGQLVQSLGSLGATAGGLARQSAMDDLLKQQQIARTGNPWSNFADSVDPYEEQLERARQAAIQRTGGW